MNLFVGVAAFVWALALFMVAWGTWLTRRHLRARVPTFRPEPVSILKPLKGVDFQLEENLESFFRLDYPRFELLFSVASETDPAYEVVQRVASKFPRVRSRIFVGETRVGGNPKVNNIAQSYQSALYDWVLVSDSNVRVPRDYLRVVTQDFDEQTGVVTAVVSGQYLGRGFGAPLEATYLNTFYARWMMIAVKFGNPVVIGKSMLFRRSQANRFGGAEVLSQYLAEDFMTGLAMKKLGKRVRVMHEPVVQMIGDYSFREFWSRHVRWGRIRRAQSPLVFPLEPLLSFWVSGACGAYALSSLVPWWQTLIAHTCLWALCDIFLMERMREPITLRNLFAWIVRETLHVPLWIHVALGRTVMWRGNRLSLASGGLLET